MNPVGSPLPAGTAPASGSAGAAQRASPSSPSNVAPSSSRPHAAGREEVSSSSLDRVLIHPLQPPGALSLILISRGWVHSLVFGRDFGRGDQRGTPKDTALKPNLRAEGLWQAGVETASQAGATAKA